MKRESWREPSRGPGKRFPFLKRNRGFEVFQELKPKLADGLKSKKDFRRGKSQEVERNLRENRIPVWGENGLGGNFGNITMRKEAAKKKKFKMWGN